MPTTCFVVGLGLAFQLSSAGSFCQCWCDNTRQPTASRQVIGLGNVGRSPGKAIYTLYNPSPNHVEFKTVDYAAIKGLQV